MTDPIPVVDIFAGPGGLGEGFSGFGRGRFRIAISAEMERSAHQTLLARAYFRSLHDASDRRRFYYPIVGKLNRTISDHLVPDHAAARAAWADAKKEALNLTLGDPESDRLLADRVARVAKKTDRWVLIGGPPCQAYSLAGRSRNTGKKDYVYEEDKRNFLYQHYLRLIRSHGPAVFVMENVKGLLTAKVKGEVMFQRIIDDLSRIRHDGHAYRLFPLGPEGATGSKNGRDYVIHCEDHGVPQARHRVIILGVREDLLEDRLPERLSPTDQVSLSCAMIGLPPLRSMLSKGEDKESLERWEQTVEHQFKVAANACQQYRRLEDVASFLRALRVGKGHSPAAWSADHWTIPSESLIQAAASAGMPEKLAKWLLDPHMPILKNHETRGHMESDLGRYAFVAAYRKLHGTSPKSEHFPSKLAPDHKNWKSGSFRDRFYVQPEHEPSSTITSHIAKDGHHFIHWDPQQCRAMTVREAARAQTFPDNYVFLGNRTEQFTQVGNAVPPFLANQIAAIVSKLLGTQH